MKWISVLVLVIFAAGACNKKDGDTADTAPADDAAAASAPATAHDAGADHEDGSDAGLPTPADFEPEATEEITDENLEKELSEIEKELGE